MGDAATRAHVLTFLWAWHAFFTSLLTFAVARSAVRNGGSPFRKPRFAGRFVDLRPIHWPVTGRWLLTALFGMFACIFVSVAWAAWTVGPQVPVPWMRLAIRSLPCAIEPWIIYRTLTVGLVNDPARMEERLSQPSPMET